MFFSLSSPHAFKKFNEPMNMKKFFLTSIVIGLTLFWSGCGGSGDDDSKGGGPDGKSQSKGLIGYTSKSLSNPFFKIIGDTLVTEGEKYGYEVRVLDGGEDVKKQDNQIDDFISQNASVIVVSSCDSLTVGAAIRKANAKGIPVFTVDLACTDPEAKITGHVESANYAGGKLAGEAMIEALGETGGKVLVLHFETADSCKQRVEGFTEVINAHNEGKASGRIVIAGILPGGGNQTMGKKSTGDFLSGNKDLAGIFAINDPSALGAYAALKQNGLEGKVKIVGFDGELAGKRAILEGKIFADPIQFPDKMAVITMQNIRKYFKGEDFNKLHLIPTALYTKADAEKDPALQDVTDK